MRRVGVQRAESEEADAGPRRTVGRIFRRFAARFRRDAGRSGRDDATVVGVIIVFVVGLFFGLFVDGGGGGGRGRGDDVGDDALVRRGAAGRERAVVRRREFVAGIAVQGSDGGDHGRDVAVEAGAGDRRRRRPRGGRR